MVSRNHRFHQTGIALLEVLISIFLLGLIITGAVSMVDNHLDKVRTTATAQQMQIFAKATQSFIKDNYAYLTAGGNGIVPATSTIPSVITVEILKNTPNPASGQSSATRYLPTGFQEKNGHRQNLCALVLQPKPNELYALIVTEGGEAINDIDLSLLAASLGATGGGIYAKNPSLAKGTLGKWEFDLNTDTVGRNFKNAGTNCAGQAATPVVLAAGHPLMALWFSEDPSSAFLYRNEVPGHPELNTLQTDIKFKGDFIDEFDKDNPRFFGGATAQLTIERVVGEECNLYPTAGSKINPLTGKKEVPLGTLARTDDGEVLFCQEDAVKKKNFWVRNLAAGRWEFDLIRPQSLGLNRKTFVGIGYLVDKNHFSGTLHCIPRENGAFACGSAGNVDCRPAANSKSILWNGEAILTTTWIAPNPLIPAQWTPKWQQEQQQLRCTWFYTRGRDCSVPNGPACWADQYQVDVVNLKIEDPKRRKW
ncbi:MAG: shufflon system plasmid conjugative transfer pilus tip adhesin PilV [Sterolibacterium sp.]|nr:shufflon system plasmid conjugative transfer pilus tip adhesin PilV [Sterolibacterium sp.]